MGMELVHSPTALATTSSKKGTIMQEITSQKFAIRPKASFRQEGVSKNEQLPLQIDATPLYDINTSYANVDPTDYLIYDEFGGTLLVPAKIFEESYWVPGVNSSY